jgi:hypothetical protein
MAPVIWNSHPKAGIVKGKTSNTKVIIPTTNLIRAIVFIPPTTFYTARTRHKTYACVAP